MTCDPEGLASDPEQPPFDLPELGAGRFGVGLHEDGAHGGPNHLFGL